MQEQFREYNGHISQMFSISYVHLLKKRKNIQEKHLKKKKQSTIRWIKKFKLMK